MEHEHLNIYQKSLLERKYDFTPIHRQQRKYKILQWIYTLTQSLILLAMFGVFFWIVLSGYTPFQDYILKNKHGAVQESLSIKSRYPSCLNNRVTSYCSIAKGYNLNGDKL